MSLGPLYVLLGEVSVQVLCSFLIGLFVFLVWSHISSLHILEIKPLSNVSWAICSPIQWVPFHFDNGVFKASIPHAIAQVLTLDDTDLLLRVGFLLGHRLLEEEKKSLFPPHKIVLYT